MLELPHNKNAVAIARQNAVSELLSSSEPASHQGAKQMETFSLPHRITAITLAFAACAAAAAPSVSDTFALRNQNSANSNNYATGDIILWGSNSVNPASTSYGYTRQCPTGSDCSGGVNDPDWVKQALFYRPYTVYPDQYFASRPYDVNLTNSWDLVLSSTPNFAAGTNALYTTQAVGSSVGSMPFVQSMTVQGVGLTPTISWQLPTVPNNVAIDAVTVRLFDIGTPVTTTNRNGSSTQSFQQADFIYESPLISGNSFQLPSSLNLQFGHQYSIAIALTDVRADGSPQSRSQSFFDFTPLNTNLNVYLPTFQPTPTTSGLTAGPLYGFNISGVSSNSVTYIDPLVATGFTFEKGANDPNFWKVEVVSNIGDGYYDVYTWDGTGWTMVGTGLAANTFFDFGQAGVSRFQIRGIEISAELNPFDVTGFVTGLMFVGEGNFTGTMQAIVADTNIPEPGTFLLLGFGLLGIGIFRRKRVI
jgi:hypothetical protein